MGSTALQDSRASEPHFPERIGRYELLLPIGSGGMATVYLARIDGGVAKFERTVALKVMHAHLRDDPEFVTAMLDEARIAALIHHPNVVSVLDAGDDRSGMFLVMDYIEGESLAALWRHFVQSGERLPAPIALKILDDMLTGLHFSHELKDERGAHLGLVHRDVSPHNVLVGTDGLSRLLDFGVAKAAGRDSKTRTGTIKGKVAYMAPEQLRGQALDRRTDVWAAAVVAWEALAGRRMHPPGLDEIALAMRILEVPPPPLRDARPDLPAALDEALAWALAPLAAERCPTAAELRRRLLDAAPAAGGVASAHEVGDLVHRVSGERLRARTSRANAVRETRSGARAAVDAEAHHDVTRVDSAPPAGARSHGKTRWIALGAAALAVLAAGGAALAMRGAPPTRAPTARAPAGDTASATRAMGAGDAPGGARALGASDALGATRATDPAPPSAALAPASSAPRAVTPARAAPRPRASGASPPLIGNPYATPR